VVKVDVADVRHLLGGTLFVKAIKWKQRTLVEFTAYFDALKHHLTDSGLA
jgi:hypothetical protein